MRDTTTQTVLGTFVATFLYCLLVLRTIRRAEQIAFVPHLSVTLGVLLAVVSVGVLIYFIHHVSVSIQANEIVLTSAPISWSNGYDYNNPASTHPNRTCIRIPNLSNGSIAPIPLKSYCVRTASAGR